MQALTNSFLESLARMQERNAARKSPFVQLIFVLAVFLLNVLHTKLDKWCLKEIKTKSCDVKMKVVYVADFHCAAHSKNIIVETIANQVFEQLITYGARAQSRAALVQVPSLLLDKSE